MGVGRERLHPLESVISHLIVTTRITPHILAFDSRKSAKVQPKRWIVERTFGWFGRYHRLSKDCERHPQNSETSICSTAPAGGSKHDS